MNIRLVSSEDYKFFERISYQEKFFLFCLIADFYPDSFQYGIKELSDRYRISHTYVNSLLRLLCDKKLLWSRLGYHEGRGRSNYIYEFDENFYEAIDLSRAFFNGAIKAKKFKELYQVFNHGHSEHMDQLNVLERWTLLNFIALNDNNVWEDSADFNDLKKVLNITKINHRLKSALNKLASLGLLTVLYSNSEMFSDGKSYIFFKQERFCRSNNQNNKKIGDVKSSIIMDYLNEFGVKHCFDYGPIVYMFGRYYPMLDVVSINPYVRRYKFTNLEDGISNVLTQCSSETVMYFLQGRINKVASVILSKSEDYIKTIISMKEEVHDEKLKGASRRENWKINTKKTRSIIKSMCSDKSISKLIPPVNIISQALHLKVNAYVTKNICGQEEINKSCEILAKAIRCHLVLNLFKLSVDIAVSYYYILTKTGDYNSSKHNYSIKFFLQSKSEYRDSLKLEKIYRGGVVVSDKITLKKLKELDFFSIKDDTQNKRELYVYQWLDGFRS